MKLSIIKVIMLRETLLALHRGVAQYFFLRSILMKRNFDTDTAEV